MQIKRSVIKTLMGLVKQIYFNFSLIAAVSFILDRCWSPSHLLMWTFPYPHPHPFYTLRTKLLPLFSCFTVLLCIHIATIAFVQFYYFFMYTYLSVVSKWTTNISFINYCISH